MLNYDREDIRKIILKKLSKKVKKIVLEQNMNGLIDEYIEKQEFIRKYGASIEDNPTKAQIKWWFQDEPKGMEVEVAPGKFEEAYEVQVDDICLRDKLASEVFQTLFKYKWKRGQKVPSGIQQLIRLTKLVERTKNKKNKEALKSRLSNIALVGVIRKYHLVRSPYMSPSQISKAINFVRKSLLSIDKLESAKYKDIEVDEEIAVFEPFKNDHPPKPPEKGNKKDDESK
jgi:hypothetical protein